MAEKINQVRSTPEVLFKEPSMLETTTNITNHMQTNVPSSIIETKQAEPSTTYTSFNNELEHMIKKIVEETSTDPVFENILYEVIPPLPDETSDDCEDRGISHTSTPNKYLPDQEGSNSSEEDPNKLPKQFKKRRSDQTRTVCLSSTSEHNIDNANAPSKHIEDQNADAVQSIIAMNSNQTQTQVELNKNMSENIEIQIPNSSMNVNEAVNALIEETIAPSSTVVSSTSIVTTTITTSSSCSNYNTYNHTVTTNAEPTVLTSTACDTAPFTMKQQQGKLLYKTRKNILINY